MALKSMFMHIRFELNVSLARAWEHGLGSKIFFSTSLHFIFYARVCHTIFRMRMLSSFYVDDNTNDDAGDDYDHDDDCDDDDNQSPLSDVLTDLL